MARSMKGAAHTTCRNNFGAAQGPPAHGDRDPGGSGMGADGCTQRQPAAPNGTEQQ